MRNRLLIAVFAALTVTLSACGINSIPTAEENAKAKWADVQNQYQRRADLIPNLVETVKGYAAHEKEVLEGVVEARAKATQVTVSPDALTDPEAFKAQLGASVLHPKRLGTADELAAMVMACLTNYYMNAETIRVDGGIRMTPK